MLEGLTSLSITDSKIDGLNDLTRLTNLVPLDLSWCTSYEGIFGGEGWSTFEAWSALQILKIAGCWLIQLH